MMQDELVPNTRFLAFSGLAAIAFGSSSMAKQRPAPRPLRWRRL